MDTREWGPQCETWNEKPSTETTPNFMCLPILRTWIRWTLQMRTTQFGDLHGLKSFKERKCKGKCIQVVNPKTPLKSLNIWMCGTNVSLGCQFRDPSVWGSIYLLGLINTLVALARFLCCKFVCNKFKSEIVHDKICLKLCPMVSHTRSCQWQSVQYRGWRVHSHCDKNEWFFLFCFCTVYSRHVVDSIN
jgi:hypothetical protein